LRTQIIHLAIDRAFLNPPWPQNAKAFQSCLEQGRARLTLIAQEIARAVLQVLTEHALAARKLKDAKLPKEAMHDIAVQLNLLLPKNFISATPWGQLAHLPRYFRAVVMRIEKAHVDAVRDAIQMAKIKPLEQRYTRLVAQRKGAVDERLNEFRWLLEELRVGLFAQTLKTPQPVSVLRLEKFWAQFMNV
jgi:ATP-dependent helicase HrpA